MDKHKLKFVTEEAVSKLESNINSNLERYLKGDFSDILEETGFTSETRMIFDTGKLSKINLISRHEREYDGLNSFRVFNSLANIPKSYATFRGIWIKLCHDECLLYARGRWLPKNPKNEETLINLIKIHFFSPGRNGYRDDNAVGRLWWTGAIIKNFYKNFNPVSKEFCRINSILCKYAQRRFDTVERARIFNSPELARGIIKYIENGNLSGSDDTRKFMKDVNREASGLVMSGLNQTEIEKFISDCDTA